MSSPGIDVILTHFHGEAPKGMRSGYLVCEHNQWKAGVLRWHRVVWSEMPLGKLDQADERLGDREIIGFDALDSDFPLDPRDRAYPGATEGVTPADAMPNAQFLAVHFCNGSPTSLIGLDPLGPAPRERADGGRTYELRASCWAEIH
jgi:hypothetical protein